MECMQLNKQINAFQSYIYTKDFTIIAITETWLSKHIYSKEIFPSGYTVIRKDRDGKGGGVLLALRNTVNVTQLSSPNDLEVISVEVDPGLILCLIYRPPNSSDQYNISLLSYLSSLDSTKNILLIGDLNLPDADWETYSGHSLMTDDFVEMAYNHNLIQHVTGSTHRDGNTLDIALSNLDGIQHLETYTSLPSNLSSDHYMITFLIEYTFSKPAMKCKSKFDYNKANWEDMNQFLSQYDFTLALNSNNTEFIWLYLKTAINSAINLYVPQVSIKKTNQPRWFNSIIRHKIKCLRTMKRQLGRHPTEGGKLKVANLQCELQRMIAEAKSDYESRLALNYAHTNNNKIFEYISNIKGREHFPTKISYNDDHAFTDPDKAQLFNKYFYSVFTTSSSIYINELVQPSSSSLHEIQFTESDVLAILTTLDVSKASGIDNFSPKIF